MYKKSQFNPSVFYLSEIVKALDIPLKELLEFRPTDFLRQ